MTASSSILLHRLCRACGEGLEEFLNLGTLRLNAFPQHLWEIEPIQPVPLILCVCKGCGLVQLDRTVPPDWMYRTYWYRSGVNESMIEELRSIVEEATALVALRSGMSVLDIGANDGTLLSMYAPHRVYRVGVEPALNLHGRLQEHCETLIPDYFPGVKLSASFSIISAIAMSYDLEDPLRFFQSIHDALAPKGVAVIQFQDVQHQFQSAAFDTVCHEHLEYYSLWSLSHLFRQADLKMQRVTQSSINGGSLRVFLRRVEDRFVPEPSIGLQLVHEAQEGLDTPRIRGGDLSAFHRFAGRVAQAKAQIAATLEIALEQGCVIDGWGASTKGNILLQVLGIGPGQLRQMIDRAPEKVGRYTITGIPIVGEEKGREDPAGMWLIPAWQFREALLKRDAWYLEQGGTMLFPLPRTEIVRNAWKGRR